VDLESEQGLEELSNEVFSNFQNRILLIKMEKSNSMHLARQLLKRMKVWILRT